MNKVLKFGLGLGLVLLACGQLMAQKYDNMWIYGRWPAVQDSGCFGNGEMRFNNDTLIHTSHARNQAFGITCLSLSDNDGNFLAHSDGLRVLDTANQIIENGDSLNYGLYWNWVSPSQQSGSSSYSVFQGIHALPLPDDDSVFYLFHLLYNHNPVNQPPTWINSSVCYSILKKHGNGNLSLVEKNISLSGSNPPSPGNLSSCKHANGRDWWIFYVGITSNCMYKYLLKPEGLFFVETQCIGDTVYDGAGLKSIFSEDGSKYVNSCIAGGINVFDFDRCSGNLSNPIYLPPTVTYDSSLGFAIGSLVSIEISNNNRFLYGINGNTVIQYDLLSSNPDSARDTIATLDNFVDTVPRAGQGIFHFFQSQVGPNGKIYICSFNGQRFLCTINNPKGKGDSCQFGMRDVILPKFWRGSMPYYPNYRLGRLIGSSCDTIYSDIKPIYTQAPWLKVFPNPANDEVQFDYNWIEWERSAECRLLIADLSGRVVMEVGIPKYSTRQSFSIKQLAAGTYLVSLRGGSPLGVRGLGSRVLATCKLVKQ